MFRTQKAGPYPTVPKSVSMVVPRLGPSLSRTVNPGRSHVGPAGRGLRGQPRSPPTSSSRRLGFRVQSRTLESEAHCNATVRPWVARALLGSARTLISAVGRPVRGTVTGRLTLLRAWYSYSGCWY